MEKRSKSWWLVHWSIFWPLSIIVIFKTTFRWQLYLRLQVKDLLCWAQSMKLAPALYYVVVLQMSFISCYSHNSFIHYIVAVILLFLHSFQNVNVHNVAALSVPSTFNLSNHLRISIEFGFGNLELVPIDPV